VTITLKDNESVLPVTSLIDRIEHALRTPVQTLVKCQDEQAFAFANQNLRNEF
jgi:GTP cyclohydrolase I